MSNIEKIKAEIERRKKGNMYDELPTTIGRYYEDRDLLAFIDSLPEEKPSEDLEEAAEMAARKIYPYEEKYKEALERAKSFQEKYGGDYAGYIFPELTESEDERIRKGLIDAFQFHKKLEHVTFYGVPSDDAIAYLEKQKEQKPVEIHVDNPNIEKFDPDVKITTSDSSADGKELLYVCNKSYDIGFRDGVASVKPSEEQMKALHRCVDYLEESDNEDAEFMESLLEQLKKL